MAEEAGEHGLKLGLWFAPDTHDLFALMDRDVAILKKAYDEWKVRFFKLDMYWIETKEMSDRFLEFLDRIYAFGDDVEVQLDVTREARVNYFCGREYGTVFVENRYTKWANYFPHRTLRNIWSLSRCVPTQKLQFEITNPDLNANCYKDNDPFVPSLYSMDYLFASVMLSNPLFWMEMQFLSEERRAELARIMPVWKACREELSSADVAPIGDVPTGRSHTGFLITTLEDEQYVLLFRESNDVSCKLIEVPVKASVCELLASNCAAELEILDGGVMMKSSEPRSYVFARLK